MTLTLIPAAAVIDDKDSLGQFVAVMGVLIAVSLVLPHYFYRGRAAPARPAQAALIRARRRTARPRLLRGAAVVPSHPRA